MRRRTTHNNSVWQGTVGVRIHGNGGSNGDFCHNTAVAKTLRAVRCAKRDQRYRGSSRRLVSLRFSPISVPSPQHRLDPADIAVPRVVLPAPESIQHPRPTNCPVSVNEKRHGFNGIAGATQLWTEDTQILSKSLSFMQTTLSHAPARAVRAFRGMSPITFQG